MTLTDQNTSAVRGQGGKQSDGERTYEHSNDTEGTASLICDSQGKWDTGNDIRHASMCGETQERNSSVFMETWRMPELVGKDSTEGRVNKQ